MLVATERTDGTGRALAEQAGLAVPTAHHLLSTLVAEGLLAKGSDARYSLGPKVAVLADALERDAQTPRYLTAGLDRLATATGETSYVAAWRQGEIRLLGLREGRLPVRVGVSISDAYTDAHARASGKLLLAFAGEAQRERYLAAHPLRAVTPRSLTSPEELSATLERARADGYASDEEEFLEGVCCVSAPVLDDGVLIAAYSVSVPAARFAERRGDLIEAVTAAASAAGDR
jgi:IclR family transcriptional regulator, acetate operon repressor